MKTACLILGAINCLIYFASEYGTDNPDYTYLMIGLIGITWAYLIKYGEDIKK